MAFGKRRYRRRFYRRRRRKFRFWGKNYKMPYFNYIFNDIIEIIPLKHIYNSQTEPGQSVTETCFVQTRTESPAPFYQFAPNLAVNSVFNRLMALYGKYKIFAYTIQLQPSQDFVNKQQITNNYYPMVIFIDRFQIDPNYENYNTPGFTLSKENPSCLVGCPLETRYKYHKIAQSSVWLSTNPTMFAQKDSEVYSINTFPGALYFHPSLEIIKQDVVNQVGKFILKIKLYVRFKELLI